MDLRTSVNPTAFRQFGGAHKAFYFITDAASAQRYTIADSHYHSAEVLAVRPGADIGRLVAELPDESAVLVAAPRTFVRGADLADIGGRRVAIMPCGSTPVRPDQLSYFLGVLERTDPAAQADRADEFFSTVAAAGTLRLLDDARHTECAFDAAGGDYVWHQQAGELGPGEQQIAPAGELSVLPMEITEFDPTRRLALTGTVTLQGEPIVHAGYDGSLAGAQADLYSGLTALRRDPVVIDLADGLVTRCRAGAATPGSARAAATLNDLFDADPRYRTVWELGFGINNAMDVVPANCGMNEVYGADHGVVHFGVGLTPFTAFALTFLCPATRFVAGDQTVIGAPGPVPAEGSRRRITRTREASCGCH